MPVQVSLTQLVMPLEMDYGNQKMVVIPGIKFLEVILTTHQHSLVSQMLLKLATLLVTEHIIMGVPITDLQFHPIQLLLKQSLVIQLMVVLLFQMLLI